MILVEYKDVQILNAVKPIGHLIDLIWRIILYSFRLLGLWAQRGWACLRFLQSALEWMWNDQKLQVLWNNHDLWQHTSNHAIVRHICATFWAHCESRPHSMATLGWAFNGLEVCFAGNNLLKGVASLGVIPSSLAHCIAHTKLHDFATKTDMTYSIC